MTSERTTWRADQGRLAFRVHANPAQATNRPPVVLVHGIGMSHRYFSRLQDVLGEGHAVFSVDLPGFGGLPKPGTDVDIPTMAAALAGVVAGLGVGPCVLVGHSMGAQWVVELAAQRPDLVSHAVVIGPVSDSEHRSVAAQSLALGLDCLGEPPLANAIVFTDYVRCGIPWYLTQVRHMIAYPIEERVADLRVPLLVLRGERDPIAGMRWCRMLRDRAGEGDLAVIPGSRHVAQFSRPRAVADAITTYAGAVAGISR